MLRPFLHSRVVVPGSALAPSLFADYYAALRDRRPGQPLVCYWDGAITAEEYERRRRLTPDSIAAEFESLCDGSPEPDLLVFSLPAVDPCGRAELRRRLLTTFEREVLPATPNERPRASAYVGYSAGAYLATVLALGRTDGIAVATVGGVGMASALAETPTPTLSALEFASFANTGDPCADETERFQAELDRRGIGLIVQRGIGGHDLADYLRNGALKAALAFARENVLRRA